MTHAPIALLLVTTGALSPAFPGVCELDVVDRRVARSERCLSCHDGSAAPAITHVPGSGGTHPVGVEYLRAYRESPAGGGLAAPWLLDRNLAFPDGTVTCVTCHDAHGPGRLAVPLGRICTECHRK